MNQDEMREKGIRFEPSLPTRRRVGMDFSPSVTVDASTRPALPDAQASPLHIDADTGRLSRTAAGSVRLAQGPGWTLQQQSIHCRPAWNASKHGIQAQRGNPK